ncbi:MAG: bifunctional aspartate kinase/homoserine dehydrogenase I, partial [Cyclobacteriaceae bacterium]
ALQGDTGYLSLLRQVEERHIQAVKALVAVQKQSPVLAQVKSMLNELEDVLHGIYLVRERTERTLDFVMSFGERLSAYIISQALISGDVACEFLDARAIIRTDNQFGHARVDFMTTNNLIADHFKSHPALQVATGFIASSSQNETTTLGRSGSDYTAAILAGALQATSLEIWTD